MNLSLNYLSLKLLFHIYRKSMALNFSRNCNQVLSPTAVLCMVWIFLEMNKNESLEIYLSQCLVQCFPQTFYYCPHLMKIFRSLFLNHSSLWNCNVAGSLYVCYAFTPSPQNGYFSVQNACLCDAHLHSLVNSPYKCLLGAYHMLGTQ